MAIVWEKETRSGHYQVRHAGGSVRLYKDGVFHSQWNAKRPLSGGVWDLLFLPSLFMPVESIKRVLVLGVGGGAVIRQYLEFLPFEKIVGVELDPIHLQVAREHFGIRSKRVELIEADALSWVDNYHGEPFDLVIEDLFTEVSGEPVRVADATAVWFEQLAGLLRPGGTLVINFEEAPQLRASLTQFREGCGDRFDLAYTFSLPTYGNCVAAYVSDNPTPAQLRARLDELLLGYPSCRSSGQKFRVRRLSL